MRRATSTLTLFSLLASTALMGQPLCELQRSEVPAVSSRAELAERLQQYAADADALLRAIPATSRDLFAVLQETELTPEGLNAWVASNTALVPYHGVLRAAEGVLSDRHGNSLDRALLLAELLELAGYDARLARTTLSASELESLQSALAVAAPLAPVPGVAVAEASGELQALLGAAPTPAAVACQEALQERIGEQVAALSGLLETAGVEPLAVDTAQALADHWWVQYYDGSDWLDLDPSGLAVLASSTLARDELPEELLHSVALELLVETASASGRQSTRVLMHEVPAHEWLTRSVWLGFHPLNATGVDNNDLAASLSGHRSWLAVLRDNERSITGLVVDTDGSTRDFDAATEAGIGRAVDDNLGGVFGNLGAGARRPAAAGQLVAAHLNLVLRAPQRPDFLARRTLFALDPAPGSALDEASATERAAGLLTGYDILVNPAAAGGGARLVHTATVLRNYLNTLGDLAQANGDAVSGDALANLAGALPRLPTPLEPLALLRAGATATVPVAANVILQKMRPASGSQPAVLELDIVSNDVAGSPRVSDTYSSRLEQGVRDTILEDMLITALDQAVVNTSRSFAQDLAAGRSWRLLSRLDAAGQPEGIRTALEAGYLVVAPPALDSATDAQPYWRIDPATGTTLGIGPSGAGAAATEYAGLLLRVAGAGFCFSAAESTATKMTCLLMMGGVTAGAYQASLLSQGAAASQGAAWIMHIFDAMALWVQIGEHFSD